MLKRLFATLVFLAVPARALAAEKPLWVAGVGAGFLSVPDYPGSDQQRGYILPLPYFVYRGKFITAGRNGIQGRLFASKRVHFSLSLSASPPVNSTDNPARRGMPDLRPMVELGPEIDVQLWRSASRRMRLDLRLPVRAAITIEAPPRQIGWLFTPVLNLDIANVIGQRGWTMGIQAG
ncbi:MAG: MipA/OmpV family protein, partial [Gammaproteobacteria bacterium]